MFDGDKMKSGESWGRGKTKERRYFCALIAVRT